MMQVSNSTAVYTNRPLPADWPGGEVITLKKLSFKIGIVSVTEGDNPKEWRLRYKCPDTGKDIRKLKTGLSKQEITLVASTVNNNAMSLTGYLPVQKKPDPTAPAIREGIITAIKLSRGNDATRKDRMDRGNLFLTWLTEHHPNVRTWCQMIPAILQEYTLAMERAGLAYNTISHRLLPVRMAWRVMVENHPAMIKPAPRLNRPAKPKIELDCLDPDEVAKLLDWLEVEYPVIHAMATLQALAGLRIMEAYAIRMQDVDLKARTIHVTSTDHHRVKTEDSDRMVPLFDEAWRLLRKWIDNQKVRPVSGELFTNEDGELWRRISLGHLWRRVQIRAAGELDNPRFALVPPHRLRASFATMCGHLGASDRLLKAVMGHKGADTLGMHYRKIILAELRTVSALLNDWRNPEIWQKSGIQEETSVAS